MPKEERVWTDWTNRISYTVRRPNSGFLEAFLKAHEKDLPSIDVELTLPKNDESR